MNTDTSTVKNGRITHLSLLDLVKSQIEHAKDVRTVLIVFGNWYKELTENEQIYISGFTSDYIVNNNLK